MGTVYVIHPKTKEIYHFTEGSDNKLLRAAGPIPSERVKAINRIRGFHGTQAMANWIKAEAKLYGAFETLEPPYPGDN